MAEERERKASQVSDRLSLLRVHLCPRRAGVHRPPIVASPFKNAHPRDGAPFTSGSVITTEGEPASDWGRQLSFDEKVFVIAEKLAEPVRLAEYYGVRVLLEPHGELTDTVEGVSAIFDSLKQHGLARFAN